MRTVRLGHVFPDSKEFPDATPKSPPAEYLSRSITPRNQSLEGLKRLRRHAFRVADPAATPQARSEQVPGSRGRIDALWTLLTHKEPVRAPLFLAAAAAAALCRARRGVRELYYKNRISPCSASARAADRISSRTWRRTSPI